MKIEVISILCYNSKSQISDYALESFLYILEDRLCGIVVRVLGYRSGGPGSIPGTTRKQN
jgi:hypothetical protein